MTDTRPPEKLEDSAFLGLFKKHPWLPSVLMEFKRTLGIMVAFIDTHVKPFTRKQE